MKTIKLIFALAFCFSVFGAAGEATAQTKPMENFAIAIHGGAGTILKQNMSPELEQQYKEKLNEALKAGYDILSKGGTSLDAVVASIKVMEDSPLFNAGKGSVFSNAGKNEMDASIMDGKTGKAGAIAGVHIIRNPIEGARAVMEKSSHVMLAGEGAEKFAKEQKITTVDPSYFYDEKRWKQYLKAKEDEKIRLDHSDTSGFNPLELEFKPDGSTPSSRDDKFGTVGAVALDKNGNLAAATSTGGMTNKKWGRVGDSPIIGAGTYAKNKTCAVSCTGHGEYFIRNVVAYDVSALMEYKGLSLDHAAKEVVMNKLKQQGGEGGLIAIDAAGNITMAFNTEGMYRGYMKKDGKSEVKIYKE